MSTNKNVTKLCSKRLRFEGAFKVVKKYWEVGPSSIYLNCTKAGDDCFEKCGDRAV